MHVNSDEWRSKLNYVRRKWHVKEDVVISGMSGRFPKSENIQEFTRNLFNGVDMVTSGNGRFPSGVMGFPMHSGKVENLHKFDAEFFGIPDYHADFMDPQLRKLLEVSFEAIIDAGIVVGDLSGSETGFFYGSSFRETEIALGEDPQSLPRYLQSYSTLVSQVFGLKGPIGQFDTACGSSTSALNEAFVALKSGLCNQALVAGYNICLVPAITRQFCDLQMASPAGRSRSLDQSADGYGRSEAVCCIVLQLKPEAKRIYSTIVNCRSNTDGYKEQGITFPSMSLQRQLMAETYDEVDLDPGMIEYVEAHATGTQAGDPVELKAIYDVFCYQRSVNDPLKIGCLKSNMGHSEAASGLCAVIKANVIFQSGHIPGNLHYKNPNPRIEGLIDGKMVPVLEKIPFSGDYISLNCFGFGGANVHLILKGHKDTSKPDSHNIVTQIPRLVLICSRTWEGVKRIQTFLKDSESSLTTGFLDLLNRYSKTPSMPYKGYTLISKENNILTVHNQSENFTENLTHKQGMKTVLILPLNEVKFGSSFMKFPIFLDILGRFSQHVKPFGINLAQLITGELRPITIREKIVAIVASQLLLYHLLKAIGVPIDDLICNWLGNFTLAFAGKLITEERALTAAFWLGHFIDHEGVSPTLIQLATNFAAHEKSYEIVADGNDIDSFAHYGQCLESSAINLKFDDPKEDRISTNSSSIDILLTYIDKYSQKNGEIKRVNGVKLSSLSESCQLLHQIDSNLFKGIEIFDSNTILIDYRSSEQISHHHNHIKILDHDTLQLDRFLKSVGDLYSMNIPIDTSSFNPRVDYPVPIDTLSLHSLISFDHHKSYKVFKYPEHLNPFAPRSSYNFKLSLTNQEDQFYSDHKIDGRILFPATGMLMYAWKVAAVVNGLNIRRSKFLFRDVSFVRATTLTADEICLKVSYMPHNGSFMISENDSPIAAGKIFIVENIDEAKSNFIPTDGVKLISNGEASLELTRKDIYKELRNRGYDYGSSFRCLTKADQYGRRGVVEWNEVSSFAFNSGSIIERIHDVDRSFLDTWITFTDSVMQLALLSNRHNRSLFVPTGIESMLVDAEKLYQAVNLPGLSSPSTESVSNSEESQGKLINQDESPPNDQPNVEENRKRFIVSFDGITKTIASEGLWIRGLKTSLVPRRSQKVITEAFEFIPFDEIDFISSDLREQITRYHYLCDEYAVKVRNPTNSSSLTKKSDQLAIVKEDFPYDENFSFTLLGFLINTLERDNVELDVVKIDQDILIGRELKYSHLDRFLGPFIGTVLNTLSYSGQMNPIVNIIEYNQGNNYYLEMIKAKIDALSIGITKVNYKIANSEPNSETKDSSLEKISHITWDLESPLDGSVAQPDLFIFKNFSDNFPYFRVKVRNLIQATKEEGFILIIFREHVDERLEKLCSIPQLDKIISNLKACCMKGEDIIALMNNLNWICVSNRLLETKLIPIRGLLFRKKLESIKNPKIIHVSPMNFEWVQEVQTLLNAEDKASPIWLIGDESCDQGVDGFMRSLRMEIPNDRIVCIANRYHDDGINFKNFTERDPRFGAILERGLKFNIYDPIHGWGEFNFMRIEREKNPQMSDSLPGNLELKVLQPGDLSSLEWCELPIIKSSVSSVRSLVRVCYAPLNFKDVMLSTARLPQIFEPGAQVIADDPTNIKIGLEFVGFDDKNQRVMGIRASGAMATRFLLRPTDVIWPIPDDWNSEDAATVPMVYGTAIYGLIVRGNLKHGESVLIHAGSGGVGIAAIHLCLSYDCTVYTTVGTPEKRKFILDRFPQLTEANIGNSRDTSFEEMVLRETGGKGVDIVLNSLADDKLQASLRCLAHGGRFLEIGKYDGFKNSPIELGLLDGGRSFHGVMLDSLVDLPENLLSEVQTTRERVCKIFEDLLNNGAIKPLPRTVFEMSHVEEAFRYMASGKHIGKVILKIDQSHERIQSFIPKTIQFNRNKVYLIVGGFGGLGLEVALWMSAKGARNIVINSRSGPKTPYHQYCIERIIERNSKVRISKHDLTTEAGARELFASLSLPVGGIFNSALVLNDGLFVDQTAETFTNVCTSKVNITYNLDRISREMCPTLDYFVVFSSIVSGRGNVGQTNYGLANSFMESVCERRRRDGLHGLAIQWGLIGDVGFVVEKMDADIESIRGTATQRLHSCLSVLEQVFNYPNSIVTSMVRSGDKKFMSDSPGDIIKSISNILGIKDIHALDPKITLGELGMDSLMAIEVQQALERNFNASITAKELRQLKICDLIMLSKKYNSETVSENAASTQSNTHPDASIFSYFDQPITMLTSKSGQALFAFPPVEGHYEPFGTLFEQLEQPVVGVNWTHDLASLTSIEQIAEIFANRISQLTNDQKINMIGYSYGGISAVAVAKILEDRQSGPKVDKLILLDADVEYLKKAVFKLAVSQVSSKNESVQEREFIKASLKRYLKDTDQLDENLEKAHNRSELFKLAEKYLISKGIEPSYAADAMKMDELILQKGLLLSKYSLQWPKNCRIIHLRADEDLPSLRQIKKTRSIGKQFFFTGNHYNFINRNTKVILAKIIEFLEK